MSAFIVSGGALLEIGCPSTLNRETEQQVAFTRTLGGKRKAFIRKGGRRSWSVDVAVARPGEVSTIEAVARDLGPVGWYGPEATAGNLYSPQASGFDIVPAGATDAGLVQLPDGTVARTITTATRVRIGAAHGDHEGVPVGSASTVTVGAWGASGFRFSGWWRDALSAPVANVLTNPGSWSGWQWREQTFTVPAGAVFLDLQLIEGTQYALPSVARGAKARPELGTGCPKAVIHSPSHSPVALWDGANYTNTSYTVTEVG